MEVPEGAPPGPATDGRAALTPDQIAAALAAEEQTMTTQDQYISGEDRPAPDNRDLGYGTCPECGLIFSVMRSGLLRPHKGDRRGRRCKGSGQAPAGEVTRQPASYLARDGSRDAAGNWDLGYATCPVCGTDVSVMRGGRFRPHGGNRRGRRCKGSGQAPAGEVTPR